MDAGVVVAGGGVAGSRDDAGRISRIEDARSLADLERLFGIGIGSAREPEQPRRLQYYDAGGNELEREYTDAGDFVDERYHRGRWLTDGDGQRRFFADDATHIDWT